MNSISVRALLVRGMIAGVIAGALALAVAYFLGESQVDAAIAIEEAHSHAAHGGGGALLGAHEVQQYERQDADEDRPGGKGLG
ncbi:CbtA family protein, partial [Streptomyces sp. NRRL WC-3725]|uniref:CbtA family protein n=1 Tax=Streptomyces sp. NRRL WC-3725 TaxID=1463933 RepID=UPI0004C7AA08